MTNYLKKHLLFIVLFCIILFALLLILFNKSNNDIISNSDNMINNTNNGMFAIMLETEAGLGEYQESKSNTWPGEGYIFNENLSVCENGSELTWNEELGAVNLKTNIADKCYVYFDLYNRVKITNISTSTTYNSITLTVETTPGDNNPSKYYFSIDDGKSYQESNTSSYTFSNLTDNTKYTIKVYVLDTAGYESLESEVEVITNAYVNPKVNSVTATNVSNNSITVSVTASGGTNNIQSYYYSINNGAYQSASTNTYIFSGLIAGQSYSIRVYVTDTNGVDSNVYTIDIATNSLIEFAFTDHKTGITTTYYAEDGMTWWDFVNSDYNDGSFTTNCNSKFTLLYKGKVTDIYDTDNELVISKNYSTYAGVPEPCG